MLPCATIEEENFKLPLVNMGSTFEQEQCDTIIFFINNPTNNIQSKTKRPHVYTVMTFITLWFKTCFGKDGFADFSTILFSDGSGITLRQKRTDAHI